MKKRIAYLLAFVAVAALAGCTMDNNSSSSYSSSQETSSGTMGMTPAGTYADGTYRGAFMDRGENQVTVELGVKDGKIEALSYRNLDYRGVDYLDANADETTKALARQYQQLLDRLVGKELPGALDALYHPENLADDVDGFTSATLRGGKVLSAIRDALNRGVYALPAERESSGTSSSSAPTESSSQPEESGSSSEG